MALPDGRSCLSAIPWRNTFVSRLRDIGIIQRAKQVARSAAGMQQGLAGIRVNFPAHAIDINLDQIREGIERFIPHVFRDFRSAWPFRTEEVALARFRGETLSSPASATSESFRGPNK